MAITLEEAKKNVQDDLQMGVIDEFQKSNFILEHIPFDDAVSPTGGGATPSYSYVRLKTQPTAEFREINKEYTPAEVTKERHTVEIKVFGGSYEIDRVIANMGGIVSEVELQQAQKIKAAQALFNDTFINGDTAKDTKAFDGLDKALTGSSTEYNTEGSIDLSTSELVTKNYQYFLDMLDEFLGGLDGTPTFIAGNNKLISKLTEFQQEIIREVVCLQADFEYENADEINSVLSSYSINGVSAQFGSSWNVFMDKGVAMKRDVYALLQQTGLCCMLAR